MYRIENLQLINQLKVSLTITSGEILFIEGKNGVGKSLLLKSIPKLIPSLSNNLPLLGQTLQEHRSHVLYVPPQVSFGSEMTVDDFFNEPLSLEIYKNHEPDPKYKNLANEFLSQRMSLLSSGQRQFIAILRALGLKAKILLLDEPFSHIDQEKRKWLMNELILWMGKERSIIMVTHDRPEVLIHNISFLDLNEIT
jgi:ABC-type nitrate/sulfonate/bicarbonate transport system ATPase subunit